MSYGESTGVKKFLKCLVMSQVIFSHCLGRFTCAETRYPAPFAMSVSGGVSLGAYQAGLLYDEVQLLRKNSDRVKPVIFTGSSAGGINALISLIEYCDEKTYAPDDSLFWHTWKAIGLSALTPKQGQKMSPVALFTSAPLLKAADVIEKRWKDGLSKSCDVAFGVTTTLLNPETINLGIGIPVQRQSVHFVLRIRGRGRGLSPLVENYSLGTQTNPKSKLYLDQDPEKRFQTLRQLLLASAAFPAAFEPVKLKVFQDKGDPHDPDPTVEEKEFIDGGVLDNRPLRLAQKIANTSLDLDKKGRFFLKSRPLSASSTSKIKDFHFHHVDTDARGYPSLDLVIDSKKQDEFISHLMRFALSFISTARTRELYSLLEERPDFGKSLSTTVSYFPRASDPWAAFFGFFDLGFRTFDYQLGMSDSKRSSDLIIKKMGLHPYDLPIAQEKAFQDNLNCVSFFMNPDGFDLKSAPLECNAPLRKNTRALSQISWARLAEICLTVPSDQKNKMIYPSCLPIWAEKSPLWTSPEYRILPWRKATAETDEGISAIHLLEQYGYHFDPTEFPNVRQGAQLQIAKNLRKVMVSMSARQKSDDREAIQAVTDTVLNRLYYVAPDRVLYATVGETNEFGYMTDKLGLFEMPDSWRVGGVLQAFHLFDAFESKQGSLSLSPMITFERDVMQFSHNSFALIAALRGGYRYAAHDKWGKLPCDPFANNLLDSCSGWTIQPALVLTFAERIRLQVLYRMLLPRTKTGSISGEVGFQLGFQVGI
jgi:predicted acylesterase/phospholipase RssA